jgi:hypothetical protein
MKAAVIALVVIIGVLGGFYGGYKVGQNNVSASAATSSNTRGSGGFAQGRGGALTGACPTPGATPSPGSQTFARGTISNLSSTSMTVSSTGCDVKVTFSPTTAVSKTVASSTSDLSDNQAVTVTGTRQADGSILAQVVQVGAAGVVIRGPGSSGASPSGAGG